MNSGETLPQTKISHPAVLAASDLLTHLCQKNKTQTPAVIGLSRLFSIMSRPSNYLCSHCPTFRRARLRPAVGSFNGACSRTPRYIKPATRYMKHRHKWDAASEESRREATVLITLLGEVPRFVAAGQNLCQKSSGCEVNGLNLKKKHKKHRQFFTRGCKK